MEIQGLSFGVSPVNKKENIFGDDIGFVEHYDFSQANMSEKHRIHAISAVASICYQSPKSIGSESLYNRLMSESKGLPSSSFEFVPVLLDRKNSRHKEILDLEFSNCKKYGEDLDNRYLLTNYRALVYDYENHVFSFDIREIYNTEKECEIIKKYFKVFLLKIDFPTRSQIVRHRVNLQELSRRFVSGKKLQFEFYVSEKIKGKVSSYKHTTPDGHFQSLEITTEDINNIALNHYYHLLDIGIKPQEARRVIPQSAYTDLWIGFQPKQLDNFIKLRLDSHSQHEVYKVAENMVECLKEK